MVYFVLNESYKVFIKVDIMIEFFNKVVKVRKNILVN